MADYIRAKNAHHFAHNSNLVHDKYCKLIQHPFRGRALHVSDLSPNHILKEMYYSCSGEASEFARIMRLEEVAF